MSQSHTPRSPETSISTRGGGAAGPGAWSGPMAALGWAQRVGGGGNGLAAEMIAGMGGMAGPVASTGGRAVSLSSPVRPERGDRASLKVVGHEVARALAGGGSGEPALDPLDVYPHAGVICRLTGHDLPGDAVADPAGCAALGVEAYTEGVTTHFRDPSPRLTVAAHEAAHQLQHAGLTGEAGLGAEGHAEAIAHRVEAGQRSSDLIGSTGAAVTGQLHPYMTIPEDQQGPDATLGWAAPGGGGLRVSDDGHLAVPDVTDTVSKAAWATADDIVAANTTLEAQGSEVRLEAGAGTLRGKAPDGLGQGPDLALSRVILTEADGSRPVTLTGDCGVAAYEVMGGADEGHLGAAVARSPDGQEHATDPHPYQNGEAAEVGTVQVWFREILRMAFGDLPLEELIARYEAQPPEERAAFERQWGINQHAVPEIGEAVSIGGHQDSPSYAYPPEGEPFYHWHFAACVLKSGHDYITLENYAGNDPKQWYFSMFGPAQHGQSFYQQESPSGAFGSETMGLVVRPAGHARLTITLHEDADTFADAEVYARLRGPTGVERSDPVALSEGETRQVVVPLQRLLRPGESQSLWLDILDQDLFGDEHLLGIPWNAPYAPARYSDDTLTVVGEIVP